MNSVIETGSSEAAETVKSVEAAISALVQRINNDVTPERVVETIAAHTKAIVSRTTTESRSRLHALFQALGTMDEYLTANEARLMQEIDHHVSISNSAAKAATVLEQTVAEWKKSMEIKPSLG